MSLQNDFKLLRGNTGFWWVVGTVIITIALIWVSLSYHHHKCPVCPKEKLPEIQAKHKKIINEIENVEDKHTSDSLFTVIWGFKPTK